MLKFVIGCNDWLNINEAGYPFFFIKNRIPQRKHTTIISKVSVDKSSVHRDFGAVTDKQRMVAVFRYLGLETPCPGLANDLMILLTLQKVYCLLAYV